MKKLLLFFLVLAQTCFAQQVNVLSIEKIKTTDPGGYFYPKISPDNQFILLTKGNYSGLYQYLPESKILKTLNEDPGAGYGVQISDDGKSVLYKKISLVQNRKYNSLVYQDIQSGGKKILVSATREPVTGEFINSKPAYVKGAKMVKAPVKTTVQQVITIEDRKMVLYTNGERKEITPNGKEASYIWPSISPDRKNIVYTVAGKGTFVCSIAGKNPVSLGKLNAPSWAGNRYVVGMDDKDDGEKLISSELVIASADGKFRKNLQTPLNIHAMYPSASVDGSKIAFCTDKGEIFLMNVELK